MTVILDYGAGNLFSIKRFFEETGYQAKICLNAEKPNMSEPRKALI